MDLKKIEKGMELIIEGLGKNIDRKKLKETPKRVSRMYSEIFSGIEIDPKKILGKIFKEEYNELVLIKDISFFSMCEHHFLPFFGKAHVAYLPDGNNVIGISKIARLVDVLSKRPQLQERITNQIVDIIMNVLTPQGAMAVIEAEHMCMIMRGIQKPGTKIVTSAMRGIFLRDLRTRAEALSLISSSIKM
ncbi:MAG: GTP cyclohydrolase I FolE [Candidatus Omnitrophica bacterium]|nr:GTP cyclohydrolase I FolE [Candidatus Omnitrophota bacterium]